MLILIPVIGPWLCGLFAESIGERVVKGALASLVTTLFFTLAILVVALVAKLAGWSEVGSWLIDLIVIAYVGQAIVGVISAVIAAAEFSDSIFAMLTGITVAMIVQAVLIPLLGLFLCWLMLSAFRGYIAIEFGGGFFHWAVETTKQLLS